MDLRDKQGLIIQEREGLIHRGTSENGMQSLPLSVIGDTVVCFD